ncbi:MAG: protein kinase domain-containing protein, partial [Planctomycetota bacterium]
MSRKPPSIGPEPTADMPGARLQPGTQIGHFRIESEIGHGGAGVVYLARDTKLDRHVAIKSLPLELMRDAHMRSRLQREAKLLASLDHPNIATIHDIVEHEESGGYLILEYIAGDTLAERISQRPLDLREALSIAQQITDAVAAAHEHDVIHRDLKPGNIKITPEGKVKVLDFGLAKAIGVETKDQQTTVTEPGRVIGTPAYMSPEQARGNPTDKRSDIWSFGCVLYEMLTGRAPFEGETGSDTLANVLQKEPEWHALPESTPANIRSLLRHCLKKDPRRRLQHIGDAGIEIDETLSGVTEMFALPGERAFVPRSFRRNMVLVALACLVVGAILASTILMNLIPSGPAEPRVVSRLSIPLPPDKPLLVGAWPNRFVAISPDGTRLVYVARLGAKHTALHMRSIDSLEIKPIPGTRGAHNPFFSPDGQWVGFFAPDLKKVSLDGGEPLPLLENLRWGATAFGSWADDGTIVISVVGTGLQRIPEDGGPPEILIAPSAEEGKALYHYRCPQVLPGGNAVLYSHVSADEADPSSSRIEVLFLESGKRHTVLDNASYATYVWSGHLIFVRDNVLMAAPFDVERLKITGPSVPLIDDVGFDPAGYTPQIAVSREGTMAYVLESEFRKRELVWVNRQGASESIGTPADFYKNPRLSPDGRSIAVTITSQTKFTSQVHIYDIQRGTLTHLTTEGENARPQWSPDGTRIAFGSRRPEGTGVFWKTVGTSAPAELLAREPPTGGPLIPHSWSHKRNLLACTVQDPNTHDDIWIIDLDGDRKPRSFLNAKYGEFNPTFSPDGRWLAYVAYESNKGEVYVREYSDNGRKEMVSAGGGINPAWSPD